ncbi:MAG: bacillithiol biosynthesis BshC [Saprospiraceae bacterium]|nr:bacillithiol biosynthesis BshC [Saprospiraceae bacterium]
MPDGTLLERRENFMTFYAVYGPAFLETLMADFDPLDFQFKMIKINA